jgi:RNA polymerase sigma-70 factor, ECF subfamily
MLVAGVIDVRGTSEDAARPVGDLYEVSYARLVGVVGAVTRDRALAEEAVQDAFVRLLGQWHKVAAYDDPEAWVRKAALGYASNRRRKFRNGVRAAHRHGPPPEVPAANGDAIDLRRALAALPLPQREAVVLQGAGLSVEEIARELGVPTGTVKSRLSRARAALAPLLREESEHV